MSESKEKEPKKTEAEDAAKRAAQKKEAVAAAAKEKSGPKIAPGKSVTSRRGILGPGTIVTPKDFARGQNQIDTFIESGHIVK